MPLLLVDIYLALATHKNKRSALFVTHYFNNKEEMKKKEIEIIQRLELHFRDTGPNMGHGLNCIMGKEKKPKGERN